MTHPLELLVLLLQLRLHLSQSLLKVAMTLLGLSDEEEGRKKEEEEEEGKKGG